MKIKKYLKKPSRFLVLLITRLSFIERIVPDELYLKMVFKEKVGYKLNLENPKTFNEKLQWLKLYYYNKNYIKMVDKYEVKKIIAEKIGEEYVVPTFGIWDSFDDIDFDILPNKFVLKCTHDSGGVVICRDKKNFNKQKAKSVIEKSLKKNYFYSGREWPYKYVNPRVMVEEYMEDSTSEGLDDYKYFCFNGSSKIMYIATERESKEETKFDYYDLDFNHLDITNGHPMSSKIIEKPIKFNQMKLLAEVLSENMPHVRIDFYCVGDKIYFGEYTFFHWSGFTPFEPKKWDEILGDCIILPEKKKSFEINKVKGNKSK